MPPPQREQDRPDRERSREARDEEELLVGGPALRAAVALDLAVADEAQARVEHLVAVVEVDDDLAGAAGRELASLLDRIGLELGPGKRLDELIAASRERRLSEAEQKEFQGLLGAKAPARKR